MFDGERCEIPICLSSQIPTELGWFGFTTLHNRHGFPTLDPLDLLPFSPPCPSGWSGNPSDSATADRCANSDAPRHRWNHWSHPSDDRPGNIPKVSHRWPSPPEPRMFRETMIKLSLGVEYGWVIYLIWSESDLIQSNLSKIWNWRLDNLWKNDKNMWVPTDFWPTADVRNKCQGTVEIEICPPKYPWPWNIPVSLLFWSPFIAVYTWCSQ